ncbi:MAG: site-specific integrase [Dehalococcoidia bacterium]|nr:site-specific integrase [Dehalococcoidia bacterium]
MTEISRGSYVKTPRDLTVAEYLRNWLRDYVEVNCAPKTIESYGMIIEKHVIPEVGNIHLAKLEPRYLQVLYGRKKAAGLGNRTVRYLYSLMAEALGHAVKTGLINRNVALSTEPPKVEHKVITTLAPDQLDRFFSAVKGILYYALFYLMLHTGLRRGEALALKWKHIDLGLSSLGVSAYLSVMQSLNKVDGRDLVQEPKTTSGKRRVALSPSLVLVLRTYRDAQGALRASVGEQLIDEDYVCCHFDGTPLDPSTVSHTFAKVLRRAGLPPMPLHGLRHTHATLLLQAGIHPKVVQERLGHSSIRVTLDTYSHVVGGLQEAAAQKFDEFLSANRSADNNVGKMSALVHTDGRKTQN